MIASAPLTVRAALPLYLEKHAALAGRSIAEIRYHLNRWERHTDDPPIQRITPAAFDDFRRRCRCGAVTIEATVNCVLGILGECVSRGLVERLPGPGTRLSIDGPDPRVVELDALGAMYRRADVAVWPGYQQQLGRGRGCRSVPHDWTPQFWRTFFVVAYFTALRFSDLLKLTREDFRSESLVVRANKTGKTHASPLHPVMMRHVAAATWAAAGGPLFPVGGSHHQFRRENKRICEAAGVDLVTPQDLRVLSANEWERARPGCGYLVQGSGIRGSARFYLSQSRPLFDALPALRVPDAFLTDEEHRAERTGEDALLLRFRQMDPERRRLLLSVAANIGRA